MMHPAVYVVFVVASWRGLSPKDVLYNIERFRPPAAAEVTVDRARGSWFRKADRLYVDKRLYEQWMHRKRLADNI